MIQLIKTILSGVVVFVFCQALLEHVIAPMKKIKELRGDVARLLVMYANVLSNPVNELRDAYPRYRECEDKFREIAANLKEFRSCNSKLFYIRYDLETAAKGLIGLSNSLFYHTREDKYECIKRTERYLDDVKKALKLS